MDDKQKALSAVNALKWGDKFKVGVGFTGIPNPRAGTIDKVKWHLPKCDGVIERIDWSLERPVLVQVQWVGRVYAWYKPEELLGGRLEMPYWANT